MPVIPQVLKLPYKTEAAATQTRLDLQGKGFICSPIVKVSDTEWRFEAYKPVIKNKPYGHEEESRR